MGKTVKKGKLVQIWEWVRVIITQKKGENDVWDPGTSSATLPDTMEHIVSLQQMKEVLSKQVGSKLPLKITHKDGDVMVRFIRGFADQQTNIVLISETSYSLAMKILEVKDIRTLQYAPENTTGEWKTLHAKWLIKTTKN